MEKERLDELLDLTKEGMNEYGELLPYVGTFFRVMKQREFEKRIAKNNDSIEKILRMIPESDFDYFGKKIGLSVIEKILTDEEEEKAEFLLLGYENTVKNKLTDWDIVLSKFDLISQLRMADIKRLVDLARRGGNIPETYEEGTEEATFINYVDRKLRNNGLIMEAANWASMGGEKEITTNVEGVNISPLGNNLLDFMEF